MDVARVRVCKGSDYVEIQLDWQYEGEKHCSIISVPLEHFRKEDMWSIVRMLLDAAENQSKKKEKKLTWISVKDRLPEDKQRVLTCKNGIIETHKYDSRRNGWVDERDWFWSMAMVAHWMPLPPAPKGDA